MIKLVRRKRRLKAEKNALLTALYFMQYSLLVILIPLVSISYMVAIFTMALLAAACLLNRDCFIIKKKILFFAFFPIFLLFIKILQYPFDSKAALSILSQYLVIGMASVFFGCIEFRLEDFFTYLSKLVLISFWLLCLIPLLGLAKFGSYMRFGYAMLPVADYYFYKCIEEKKNRRIGTVAIYCVAGLEVFLFGARGATFSHLLFIFCVLFMIHKPYKLFLLKLAAGMIGLIVFFNLEPILFFLKRVFNAYGLRVYAIDKFILQLNESFSAASSGRMDMWFIGIEEVKEHYLLGSYFSFVYEKTGADYFHNWIIQLTVEFGLLISSVVIISVAVMLWKVTSEKDKTVKYVFFLLFSIAFGRLMFSSTYWKRPELWLLFSMYLSGKFGKAAENYE